MRKLPTIIAGLFIAITLTRVADFSSEAMKAGWMGWAFSIGLGVSVYLSAYWMRVSAITRTGEEDRKSKWTRRVSLLSLVFFASIDGFFNLVDVLRTVEVEGSLMETAAYVFGLFPTAAAALLGLLQGYIDRLPVAPKRSPFASVKVAFAAKLIGLLGSEREADTLSLPSTQAESLPAASETPALEAPLSIWQCDECPRSFATQNALNAHQRTHKRNSAVFERRNGHRKEKVSASTTTR